MPLPHPEIGLIFSVVTTLLSYACNHSFRGCVEFCPLYPFFYLFMFYMIFLLPATIYFLNLIIVITSLI